MEKEELRKNSRIMVELFRWSRSVWRASETPLPHRVMIAAVQVVLRRVPMVGLAKFSTGRGPCLRRIEEHMNCSRRMHDYSKRRIYKVLIWALSPDHNTLCCSASNGKGLAGLRDADHPRLCRPPANMGFHSIGIPGPKASRVAGHPGDYCSDAGNLVPPPPPPLTGSPRNRVGQIRGGYPNDHTGAIPPERHSILTPSPPRWQELGPEVHRYRFCRISSNLRHEYGHQYRECGKSV